MISYNDIIKERMSIEEIKEYINKHNEICILSTYINGSYNDLKSFDFKSDKYNFKIKQCDNTPPGKFGDYYYITKNNIHNYKLKNEFMVKYIQNFYGIIDMLCENFDIDKINEQLIYWLIKDVTFREKHGDYDNDYTYHLTVMGYNNEIIFDDYVLEESVNDLLEKGYLNEI